MKKIILLFIFGMFLISFSSATDLGIVKQDDCIDLYQFCPSCTYVNFTAIKFPNSTIDTFNKEMTKDENNYNYTFCNTSELGEHFYTVCGDKDGTETCEDISFLITQTGEAFDTAQGLMMLGLILVLVLLTGSFLIFGAKTEYTPFKIFLTAMGSLLLLVTIGISVNAVKELMLIGSVFAGTFVNIYRLMLILVSAGGIGLMLYIVYMSVRQFYSYRGISNEDDY